MTGAREQSTFGNDRARRAAERDVRLTRERTWLRTITWSVTAVVVLGSFATHPAPGFTGKPLALTLVLALYVLAAAALAGGWARRSRLARMVTLAGIGGSAVALASLQPGGPAALAAGVAILSAGLRLPIRLALVIVVPVTAGLAIAAAGTAQAIDVLSSTLLCALLFLVAVFVRQAQVNGDRTEFLLSELEDARDGQARAAAAAAREHIARELHDVLAHSLSGLNIQLEAARMLATREQASEQLQSTIERSGELAREGLVDARRAVSALRSDQRSSAQELEALLATCQRDLHVDASLTIEGTDRPLTADASLALYRAVQESLTNVARYAPGSIATVVVRYEPERTLLTVENTADHPATARNPTAPGGGNGLAGMRKRAQALGGQMAAGPTLDGWRVMMELPA